MRELALALAYAAPWLLVALRRAIPETLGLERAAPDPVLLAVVVAGVTARPLPACLFAAAAGLLGDVPSGTPFGLGGARLALVAALIATTRRQLDTNTPLVPSLLVLGAGLLDRALAAIVLDATGDVPLRALLVQGALDALATVALVPLLWPTFRHFALSLAGRR